MSVDLANPTRLHGGPSPWIYSNIYLHINIHGSLAQIFVFCHCSDWKHCSIQKLELEGIVLVSTFPWYSLIPPLYHLISPTFTLFSSGIFILLDSCNNVYSIYNADFGISYIFHFKIRSYYNCIMELYNCVTIAFYYQLHYFTTAFDQDLNFPSISSHFSTFPTFLN